MKLAVVLFNLGGPDSPAAVRPFLFNLFADKAIIGAPWPVRLALAALISGTRAKAARANYARMDAVHNGGSPLLAETLKQQEALEAQLREAHPADEIRVFTAMRYWTPFTAETAGHVARFAPDEIVLLPFYPQFSTTTTASSLAAWRKAYGGPGRTRAVCCHPTLEGLIEGHVRKIEAAYEAAGRPQPVRLLFSAHGLPQSMVKAGDPYPDQVQATAAAVVERLSGSWDWRVCYQSRVGPMKWIGPSTADAIREASDEGLSIVVCPIAFVSEHIETLVELDIDYAEVAERHGCPAYIRVPALGVEPAFIQALAQAVTSALSYDSGAHPAGDWTCDPACAKCPMRAGVAFA